MRQLLPKLGWAAASLLSFAIAGNTPDADQGKRPPPPPDGQAPIPPREAFTACVGKHAGDMVSFVTIRGDTVSGRCAMIPAQLAAIVEHPPRQPEGKPPVAGLSKGSGY